MSVSFSAVREQYLRRHENPVDGALRTVEDVVGMIAESQLMATGRRDLLGGLSTPCVGYVGTGVLHGGSAFAPANVRVCFLLGATHGVGGR